jgi:hypothetical protein
VQEAASHLRKVALTVPSELRLSAPGDYAVNRASLTFSQANLFIFITLEPRVE